MFERTVSKQLRTPSLARSVAQWAIKSAKNMDASSLYAFITASVFTSFMVEGVIQHIGQKLDPHWQIPQNKRKFTYAKSSLAQCHKRVRDLLDLPNSTSRYREISNTICRLKTIRDSFAHPKELFEIVQDLVETPDEFTTVKIHWEKQMTLDIVQKDFVLSDQYCFELLQLASDKIENACKAGWKTCREMFPHLQNPELEALNLVCYLGSYWSAESSYKMQSV